MATTEIALERQQTASSTAAVQPEQASMVERGSGPEGPAVASSAGPGGVRGWSLSTKFLALMAPLCLCGAGVLALGLISTKASDEATVKIQLAARQRTLLERFRGAFLAHENLRQILASTESFCRTVSNYAAAMRRHYTENTVIKLREDGFDVQAIQDYRNVKQAIPNPATFLREVNRMVAASSDEVVELLSKWPVNPEAGLTKPVHHKAWAALSRDRSRAYRAIEREGDGYRFYYVTADVATQQGCVDCHNSLPNSPRTDWKVGDLMGILVVSAPVHAEDVEAVQAMLDDPSAWTAEMKAAADEFEETLRTLRQGGTARSGDKHDFSVTLAAETDPALRELWAQVEQSWSEVKEKVQKAIETPITDPEYNRLVNEFDAAVGKCRDLAMRAIVLTGAEARGITSRLTYWQFGTTLVGAAVLVGLVAFMRRRIGKPLAEAAELAQAVAVGDLTRSCDVRSSDEVGQLVSSLNNMGSQLRGIVGRIYALADEVNQSVESLAGTARQLSEAADATSERVNTVTDAVEGNRARMASIGRSIEEVADNIRSVAAAIEEMEASIREIAGNATKAASVAEEARGLVKKSNEEITDLGAAAQEINKVIETIEDIAAQTNLLALNAAIEAARAGHSGKGFAVVANQVKELAHQTAESTNDIRNRIRHMQESTQRAVEAVGKINSVIFDVSEASRAIAAAVEEQSITTREVAQNVASLSQAADTIAETVSEAVRTAEEISAQMNEVKLAAQDVAAGAAETRHASDSLAAVAERLRALVTRFRLR